MSMSLLDTSYLSPTEANDETPSPSRDRCSSRPAAPGGGCAPANVAFSLSGGTAMPKQFGPTRRMPYLRQIASSREPASASMPEVTTTSERAPRRPHSPATSVTLGAGTAITATSGGSGRSATDGTHGTPSTDRACGFTP